MLIILLLHVICLLPRSYSLLCSKSPPIHHKGTLTRDRVTGKLSEQTLVTISLGLKETACFSLENAKYWHKSEVYGISLDDVKSVLLYKNSYSFGIPNVDVKCVCDCPGAEDFCNSNTDSCKENGIFAAQGTCYSWYEQGKSNSGCTAFLSGSAEVCCSINVTPQNRTIWRAIELGPGANRAMFSVTSLNTQRTVTTEVDIEGGHPILQPFYLTVSAPSIQSPLKAGWYFGSDTGDTLYGGVELNGLSEYDTDKLGWYKFTRGMFEMDKSQIMDSFNVEVDNCDSDELNVEFDNKNTQKTFHQATELNQLFKTSIAHVERSDSERRVEAFFRQYSNIELTLTLEGDYTVVQVFDVSHFRDFDGVVMMDKHSNYFVNITIYEGEGSIRGNLTVDGETDVFKINIPEHQSDASIFYIRLSSLCEAHQQARLCLFTEVGVESVLCKPVECIRELLQEFELPDSAIDYEKGEKMSILSPATWAKHLNPAEWFNGIKNWKEGLIMATELVGIFTVIGVVLKLLKVFGCLGKCWACIIGPINCDFLKKRREKVQPKLSNERDRERRVLIDEIRDHLTAVDGNIIHQNMNYRHRSQSSESSPSYLVSTPRYIELDDAQGNPVTLMTTTDPNIFVWDKNTTLSTTANSTPQSSRTSTSTPQSQRKAYTLPVNSSLSNAPPVPPRAATPGINLTPIMGKKSSTLPNPYSATPPPSRIPVALSRMGRRHTVQDGVDTEALSSPSLQRVPTHHTGSSRSLARAPGHGSPNLARMHLTRALFNDQEMELMTNSTESLLSRGGQAVEIIRDAPRRPGHSRNGSRVLLLKNSSEL